MSVDRPFFAGERGHFCAGCDLTPIRHFGCRASRTLEIDPTDPNLLEMKAKAREVRGNAKPNTPSVETNPTDVI